MPNATWHMAHGTWHRAHAPCTARRMRSKSTSGWAAPGGVSASSTAAITSRDRAISSAIASLPNRNMGCTCVCLCGAIQGRPRGTPTSKRQVQLATRMIRTTAGSEMITTKRDRPRCEHRTAGRERTARAAHDTFFSNVCKSASSTTSSLRLCGKVSATAGMAMTTGKEGCRARGRCTTSDRCIVP